MQYECYLNRCPCVANALFLTKGWLNPQVQFPQTWKAHSIAVLNSVSFFSVLNKGILSCLVLGRNVDWKHCDRVFLFSPESLAIDSYNVLLVWGAQSCPTLCDPVDCSLPGSSVHGISQARILEWVAIFFPRRSSWPKMEPTSPALAGRFFTTELPGKPIRFYIDILATHSSMHAGKIPWIEEPGRLQSTG